MQKQTPPGESAESVIHRIWSTEGTRIMLGVIFGLAAYAWGGIKDDVETVRQSQAETNKTTNLIQSDVRNINTRLDEGVIKQVAEQKEILRKHDERLLRLEQKARLP